MSFPYEPINVINKRLEDHYGLTSDQPTFRLTWPNNEFELRKVNQTAEGFDLIYPEYRRVYKYPNYLHNMWVLEKLVEIPNINQDEIPELKTSYEPIYHFYDINPDGEYIAKQPAWRPIQFLIDQLIENVKAGGIYTKYKHPDEGLKSEELIVREQLELDEISEYLFGDETDVGDALSHKYGIVVPKNYEKALIKES